MNTNSDPLEWEVPEWHEDYGDPRVEIEALRAFATALCNAILGTKVQLEIPEPGVMYLTVLLPSGLRSEVYLVPDLDQPGTNQYGLFVGIDSNSEMEEYRDSVDSAVEVFAKLSG